MYHYTMYNKDWSKLIKSNNGYRYESKAGIGKEYSAGRYSFTQLAVDHDEERLIVVNTKGYLYCVELSEDAAYIKKMGEVGQVTCIAFNPIYKREVLIGLNTGDIKIWKLYTTVDDDIDCLLTGHKFPPMHISFYKNYCLTCSRNEVIIWHLQSYQKIHQLRISGRNAVIKKAAFSNAGHIIVLYHNDTMQAWIFGHLDKDTKIDTKLFDSRYVKDFIFTKDGRAMIIAGARNISILSTYDWSLLKKLHFSTNFTEARQLSIVPLPLDGGANKIIALLSSKCNLHFCDVSASSLLEISEPISGIKKFAISSTGRCISYIDQEGNLNIIHMEKVISADRSHVKKSLIPHRLRAHKINDHLDCVRGSMKRELNTKRLIPILKEFGKYPNKYRAIIWSTILKLPTNKNAYVALASNITYKKSSLNILKDYPLADKSKASLLAMTMDCLLQWCPLLTQSPYIPNLIFPFLMVFQRDPLLAFEASLSILLNYCQKWFEYHPFPPLNILGIIENILLEADPVLLNTFCEHGVTSTEYAWPLLQTAMSEILSEDEWLILWDHLISFQKPSLLLFCIIAYSTYSRENIISLIKSSGDIKAFYNTQSHVRAKDLLKVARRLDQEISEHMHPNRYLKDELLQLNQTGPYSLFILKQYPTFITENFYITDPRKLKMEEHLQEYHGKVVKCAEKRRLRDEIDAFVKQIHEMRMDEIQKCFQKHSSSINWQLEKMLSNTEKEKLNQFLYKELNNTQCNKCKSTETIVSDLNMSSQHCKKLQQDVTKLEYEVQHFLDSLTSCRSKIDIS